MPSKLYLRGDSDPIWLALPADAVLSAIQDTTGFVRLDMVPWTRDEHPKPAYFDVSAVSAVLPVDPREYEAALDEPPEWLS